MVGIDSRAVKNRAKSPRPGRPTNGVQNGQPPPRLNRTTFHTSREMDFFSKKELVTQTGHAVEDWPLVIVKESIDNALDACEEADIPPVIEVVADASGITIADNGPGLPESTLKAALDFTIRASNREAYVSPCRGAQGNALKTLIPMAGVLDPDHGKFIVEAHGKRHAITCGADPISQRAVIQDDVTENVKNDDFTKPEKASFSVGTKVRIEWAAKNDNGITLWPFGGLKVLEKGRIWEPSFANRFRTVVEGFAIFNPHATISLNWFGKETIWETTDKKWAKWKPYRPTSSHWYELPHLERLIGAYITHDQDKGGDRPISDLIAEFDGLSGSLKRARVLEKSGLKRVNLSELVVDGRFDSNRIVKLLAAMQGHTRPVKSERLGIIGEDHLRTRLLAMGIKPESFRYSKKLAKCKNSRKEPDDKACLLPWVLESAFGWLGEESRDRRRIFSGANWSAAIKNPFRSFGNTGEGLEGALWNMRVSEGEPVVVVLHLAHPRVEYTDRGKSALLVEGGDE